MPVESAADRLTFVSVDDFGVEAAYSQNDAMVVTIPGIFDRQHLAIEAGDAAVTGFSVTFTCRADDLAQLPLQRSQQGDWLTIDGERWIVVEPQPDGTGMVVLLLKKA
jgi:hypothetical protein